jgi:hypothetical protein
MNHFVDNKDGPSVLICRNNSLHTIVNLLDEPEEPTPSK